MLKRTNLMASVVALAALSSTAMASPDGVKVGVLTCTVDGGWGYVIGSSKDLTCSYRPNHGESDHYAGSISKFGVDIGYTSSGTLVWDVIAPTSDTRPGALEGDYAGATASATIAAGIGAHVLFGGFDKSIALQPVSFESNSGLDVAAGIGELSLHEAPPARMTQASEPPQLPPPVAELSPKAKFAVSFDFNKATLTHGARRVIRDAAREASHERPAHILVVGHADSVGSDDYNASLSLRRAEFVKDELVHDGLDREMITMSGRGYHDPAVPTGPNVRERQNRQVVVEFRSTMEPRQASR